MDRQQLNSSLITLCTSGLISGITTLSILATLPKPYCEVVYKQGVPERVIGRMNYSGPAYFVSLLSSVAVTVGFGSLLLKASRKEIKTEESGEVISLLGESKTKEVNFSNKADKVTDANILDKSIFDEPRELEVLANREQEDAKKYLANYSTPETNISLTKESLIDDYDDDDDDKKQNRVVDIVETIKDSTRSVIIAAESGTGKSSLTVAILVRLGITQPNTKVYIVGMKRDSWVGYADIPGRSFVYTGTKESKKELLLFIRKIGNKLTKRVGTPQEERDFSDEKIVLLLDDWAAVINTFKKDKEESDEILSILGNIYLLGREVFVKALVITQSFNLTSLGLSDSNARNCLSMFSLVKVTNEEGTSQNDGGVATATNMINNSFVIGDPKERARLLKELDHYKEETERTNLPAIVCVIGARPFIQMLPDLRGYGRYRVYIPDQDKNQVEDQEDQEDQEDFLSTTKIEDPKKYLENLYSQSPSLVSEKEKNSFEIPEEIPEEKSKQEKLRLYLKAKESAEKEEKSVNYILKYVLKMEGRNLSKGKQILKDLIKEFGTINFVYYENKCLSNPLFNEDTSEEDTHED